MLSLTPSSVIGAAPCVSKCTNSLIGSSYPGEWTSGTVLFLVYIIFPLLSMVDELFPSPPILEAILINPVFKAVLPLSLSMPDSFPPTFNIPVSILFPLLS